MRTSLGQDLADAGFPRKRQFLAQSLIDPTLAELMEQCIALSANGQFSLERHRDGTWSASIQTDTTKSWGEGRSAEDAAAKLWLVVRANERYSRIKKAAGTGDDAIRQEGSRG